MTVITTSGLMLLAIVLAYSIAENQRKSKGIGRLRKQLEEVNTKYERYVRDTRFQLSQLRTERASTLNDLMESQRLCNQYKSELETLKKSKKPITIKKK